MKLLYAMPAALALVFYLGANVSHFGSESIKDRTEHKQNYDEKHKQHHHGEGRHDHEHHHEHGK